jgi:hypothetical protein
MKKLLVYLLVALTWALIGIGFLVTFPVYFVRRLVVITVNRILPWPQSTKSR